MAERSPLPEELAPPPEASGELQTLREEVEIAHALLDLGAVLGEIGIEYSRARRFSPAERSLAAGVARQVGAAVGNARRYGLLTGLRSFGLRTGAQLRLSGVVEEVVAAARDLLGGDDAAVYMLDANRNVLVPVSGPPEGREEIGLDDGVWGALHSGRSIFIPEIDVPEEYVCAVATGIPRSNLEMMGALLVLFRRPFDLGPDEAEALRVAAAQAAIAIENAQRFERQQSVARSLQRGLMAVQMPELAGCEVAALYEPADSEADIGGDFFDVFEVDGGVGVVVGDVSGKGAEAAAQTAMAKYMLRAFAMRNPRPASVLHHLNNALVQSMGEDRFTTVVYALFEPDEQRCEIVSGGHPPPLHYRRAEADAVDIALQGSILGAFRDQSYTSQVLEMQPGDALVAFTDGLVEARSGDELYGRSRVKESLARHGATASAQDLVRLIHGDARAFGNMGDDTIVFALRCPPDTAR